MPENSWRQINGRAFDLTRRSRLETTAPNKQERVLLVEAETAMLTQARGRRVIERIKYGVTYPGNTEFILVVGLACCYGDCEGRVRPLSHRRQFVTCKNPVDPVHRGQETDQGINARPGRGGNIDGGAKAVGGNHHIGGILAIL